MIASFNTDLCHNNINNNNDDDQCDESIPKRGEWSYV